MRTVTLFIALGALSCSGSKATPSGSAGQDGASADAAPQDKPAVDSVDAIDSVDAVDPPGDVTGDAPAVADAHDAPPGGCVAPTTRGQCTPPTNSACPAPKLSLTGCMDATKPTSFAANVVPYEVNSPLWSDSAYKDRGFALPAGKKIHVKDCAANPDECPIGPADTGKWVLPVGTVMVKTFKFGDKLVETRLLVHPDEFNWNGYSYQWNDAQTEATLVPDARVEAMFDTGADAGAVTWHYPSRIDCGDCHTLPAGGTLGPETRQMNRVVGGVNQIDRFAAMSLFDAPVPKPYQEALVLPYPGQLGTPPASATLEQRARSYLHVNCANCHRPDADFNAFDLRYDVALHDTKACGTTPTKANLGVDGALNLAPEMPMRSMIWIRMNAPFGTNNNIHMPRIATYQFDTQGLQLISDWITSVKTCP